MKAFNILSFSLLLTIASAAAVPDVDGTITNDAGNNKRARFCGQICLNNTGCGGKCPKCDMKSLTCKKA
ncbi:hypothetical protein KXW98_003628 [Aspergillus fumigatus]|nr:hypothetical protein CNMCM8714_002152 [Aspergillus fumigatus]KAF4260037.1 hypothetical protein CNMCM8057_002416 [Aspergillus fumigatus]KAF4266414.1 hypothetical protein CNMCM8812_002741 [Aspergillus fumigatus]KAF4280204.1 hypothetical protein CNMCM8689_002315 [Aspergillus fumigatus]KAF4290823.1 hypothetical protein CNMCM8686_000660 [Aspergillus fumigatus]